MIRRAHPIQGGLVRRGSKEIIVWWSPTGSLNHTRDPFEGVHVGVLPNSFLKHAILILYGGHRGSGQGIGYVFLGLNTVRRFTTRGRNHNRRGRVHRSDRSNDWNGYAPHLLT